MQEHLHHPSIAALGFTLLLLSMSSPLTAQVTAEASSTNRWTTNFKDAKESAAAEKKDIAILFTASDWLDLAKTFDKKILNQQKFIDSASSHYALLRLDFPKNISAQSKQTTTQNQLLMQAYRVRGLPTLVLTDSLGRPYAITGYNGADLDSWIQEFNLLRQTRENRDRLFAEANKTKGVERAKLLAQAVPDLPGNLAARFYRNILNEVITLDPDNQTGRIGQYKLLIADVRYADQMQKLAVNKDDEKMLELSNQYLREAQLEGPKRQSVLFHKADIYTRQGKKDDSEKMLKEIVSIDPDSPQGKQAAGQLNLAAPDSNKEN
ncbi:MAG: hypothetical protein GXP30_03165 [Verrucomicrobia bacterium]|nr:hypothetical protein [Verrucomicrobiota bacterium]